MMFCNKCPTQKPHHCCLTNQDVHSSAQCRQLRGPSRSSEWWMAREVVKRLHAISTWWWWWWWWYICMCIYLSMHASIYIYIYIYKTSESTMLQHVAMFTIIFSMEDYSIINFRYFHVPLLIFQGSLDHFYICNCIIFIYCFFLYLKIFSDVFSK